LHRFFLATSKRRAVLRLNNHVSLGMFLAWYGMFCYGMETNRLHMCLDEARQVRSYTVFGTMTEHIQAGACGKDITAVLQLVEQDKDDMIEAFSHAAKSRVARSTYFRDGVMYQALIIALKNDAGAITDYSMIAERN